MNEPIMIDQMLAAADEEVRLLGLKTLARDGAEARLDAVFRALGDVSWRVRKEAVDIFLSLPVTTQLAGEVIELLHSEDNAGLRNAAVEILVAQGRAAVPYLVEELHCSDHDVRKFVLDILGEIGDDSATAAMVATLADPDGNVRAAAAENLGKLRSAAAVPALLDALDGPDLLQRFTILEALGQIGVKVPSLRLLPLNQNRLLRKALFDCLGKIGDEDAIPILTAGLRDDMRNAREAAAMALSRLCPHFEARIRKTVAALGGTAEVMVLAELLDSHDPAVRQSAVRLIGWSGDVRLASRLLDLLDHEELRQEAAAGLVGFGPEAAKTLMTLWPEASQRMRAYMAYIFAETGCVAAIGLLQSALAASDSELRMTALQALGRLGGVEQLPTLAQLLNDEVSEVGEAAVQAICHLGERFREQAVAALAPQLVAEDPAVRMRIVQILSRLGGAGIEHYLAFALKDESALVRRAAVRACEGQSGESQIQSLMLALTDEDNEVRRLAAEALGASGNPQVMRPLELALRDEDIWVRSAAVRALGRVGRGDAVNVIEGALHDPVGLVVIAALETLEEVAGDRAATRMVELLGHDDEEVVSAALQLLSRSGQMDWIEGVAEGLLNHHHWEVRTAFARIFAEARGAACRGQLEERLLVEGEELVRQQLRDLLMWLQEL
ncbi:MAG: hypothetical protein A2005_12715 [Desulfuromonadales bacterium GWC2_61_20]|nr:MAG: hypothetical protein A2005_12715 [Desulfuromonadales bacterium GWC2_61_20]HAD05390.1 hypothetical protein [Desulfuromonas sp.]